MGYLGDSVNYIIFTNPVSAEIGKALKNSGILRPKSNMPPPPVIIQTPLFKLAQEGGPWVRLAGLMGASAVILGAYGAHKSYPDDSKTDYKRLYETANRFHFIHSLALLGAPLCKKPMLSGTLLTLGMVFFCGTCYYHAFTGDRRLQRLAPVGGTCLILGWLSMVL